MAEHVCEHLRESGVKTEAVRCADYAITPGVESDMGHGDEWPKIRQRVLDADILLLSTPVWLGHPSSITQRVLERLDAELSSTDDAGQADHVGKVAIVSVVGNEDGAHKAVADCFQALNDIGFTIPAQGSRTGTARRCRRRTTRTSTRCPSRSRRQRQVRRATPSTWPVLLRAQQYPPYR